MKNNVNLVRDKTTHYEQVQDNIFGQISRHLSEGSYSQTRSQPLNDDNVINISLFIRVKADVLMSHGVADKNYLFMKNKNGELLVNKFSHVLVPGPWLKKRLLSHPSFGLKEDQVHVVGWPRLDYLLELKKQASKKTVLTFIKKKINSKNVNVLWAPTHNTIDANVKRDANQTLSPSSFPKLNEFLPVLENMFNFQKALHPRNKGKNDKRPTAELMASADVVISDMGTMVYEAWALGIPVVFPRWLLKDSVIELTPGSAEAYIFEKKIGLHAESFEEMCTMLKKERRLGQDVKQFLEEYLPKKFNGSSGKRVSDILVSLEKNF